MSVKIDYGNGVTAEVEPGTSVLEASLGAGIDHACACAGLGRCTTCRVRVVVGQLGYFRDRHLNAVGDALNLVSRLEDLNRELATGILLTQDVVDACPELPELGRRFSLDVRGRSAPVTAWEVLERAAE